MKPAEAGRSRCDRPRGRAVGPADRGDRAAPAGRRREKPPSPSKACSSRRTAPEPVEATAEPTEEAAPAAEPEPPAPRERRRRTTRRQPAAAEAEAAPEPESATAPEPRSRRTRRTARNRSRSHARTGSCPRCGRWRPRPASAPRGERLARPKSPRRSLASPEASREKLARGLDPDRRAQRRAAPKLAAVTPPGWHFDAQRVVSRHQAQSKRHLLVDAGSRRPVRTSMSAGSGCTTG